MRRHPLRAKSARSIKPTVERVESRVLLATFTVTNTNNDTKPGSLGYAITESNATPGSNIIKFNIATSGVQTIIVSKTLPAITVPVTIDGTTEPGYTGTPLIDLFGESAGPGVDGLDVSAGGTTIKGLAINGFFGDGINLSAAGGDTIEDDFIGTDPTGTIVEANGNGILVQANSDNNTIRDNLISGNQGYGIDLNGSLSGTTSTVTSGNLIIGNLIGTDITGTNVLFNVYEGISVQNAPMTTIGGTTPADRNVLSGNGDGLTLFPNSIGTIVEGNYIGTDVTGEVALGNNAEILGTSFGNHDDIYDQGISNCTIGGTAAGAGNVISGSSAYGISAVDAGENLVIEGNLIGTDATGTRPLGNVSGGIDLFTQTGVTIGGSVAAARNVISANGGDGIAGEATVVIQGNDIGTDITGTMPLGNGGDGINPGGGVVIGGLLANEGNIIANNGFTSATDHDGVNVGPASPVLSNSIYNNQALGIDENNGNPKQAAPVLTSAFSFNGTSTIAGTLATRTGSYTLQFFSTPSLNASGNAEGKTLLATETLTAVGSSTNFSYTIPSGIALGSYITATAIDASGDTSPFSTGMVAVAAGPPSIVAGHSAQSVTHGQEVTDTFTIANLEGSNDAGVVFSDPIPAGTTFVSGFTTTRVPVTLTGGVATANLGTLTAGQIVIVSIVLMTSTAAEPAFTNTGSVTATTPPVTSGTDTASVTTAVVTAADLGVAITGPSATTTTTGKLSFTATVTNVGPDAAMASTLTDTFSLPTGATLSSEAVSQGTVSVSGGVVTASFGSIANAGMASLTVVVTTTVSGTFADSASVTSTTADPNENNNSASTSTTVNGVATISLTPSSLMTTPGKTTTLSAQVSVPPGFVAATKSVTFYDGSTSLGSATLNASGKASLVVTLHGTGKHSLSASYSGDSNYATATSATTTVRVGDAIYGDYDGDGKSDIAIYDQTAATFYILYSGGGSRVQQFGNVNHTNIPVVSDFDGDGKDDLAIYDQTAAEFYILYSNGGSLALPFGNPAHMNIPVAGDFDGDGKTDIAIYDQTAAEFFILYSKSGSLAQPFGNPADKNIPVAGDFDGDGKSDIAIYDQTAATFYVLYSAGGSRMQQLGNVNHTNIPVAGDFDGDGKSDLTIYDQTNGYLYSLDSGGGASALLIGRTAQVDIPLSGDFDGDGKTDVGIYDETDGEFFVTLSAGGTLTQPFGSNRHVNRPV